MTKARLVALKGAISWRSRHATHIDRRYFGRVSLWRDILPADISWRLAAAAAGDVVRAELAMGDVVDVYESPRLVHHLDAAARARIAVI